MMRLRQALSCALLVITLAGTGVSAQDTSPDVPEFDGLNFGFASVAGSGFYSVNGRSAWIIRLPISFSLWSVEEKRWGVRIIAPITFGFYDLEPQDLLDGAP